MSARFETYLRDKNLCLATFLNPRFKLKKQQIDLDQIKNWILEHNLIESSDDNDSAADADSINNSEQAQVIPSVLVFFSCFENLGNETNVSNEPEIENVVEVTTTQASCSAQLISAVSTCRRMNTKDNINQAYIKEIDDYSAMPILQRDKGKPPSNVFVWWNTAKLGSTINIWEQGYNFFD